MESGNQPFFFFPKLDPKCIILKSQNKNCVPNTRDRNLAKKIKYPTVLQKRAWLLVKSSELIKLKKASRSQSWIYYTPLCFISSTTVITARDFHTHENFDNFRKKISNSRKSFEKKKHEILNIEKKKKNLIIIGSKNSRSHRVTSRFTMTARDMRTTTLPRARI
jgi:hypothetical protein